MKKTNPWLALTLALSACEADVAPGETFVLSDVLASDRIAAAKLPAARASPTTTSSS